MRQRPHVAEQRQRRPPAVPRHAQGEALAKVQATSGHVLPKTAHHAHGVAASSSGFFFCCC